MKNGAMVLRSKKLLGLLPGICLVLLLWLGASYWLGQRMIPPPWVVFSELFRLLALDLPFHLLATLGRALAATLLALVLALPSALAMSRSLRVERLLRPALYLLYPVPKIALFPVLLLVFGLNEGARISVVCLVLYFQMVLDLRSALRQLPEGYRTAIRSLGAGYRGELRHVELPFLLPRLFATLRVGLGTALAVLFFAETFFSSLGLGFLIMDSWMRIDYPRMFAGIVALGILGAFLFALLDLAERLVCPWLRVSGQVPRRRSGRRRGAGVRAK